MKKIYIFVDFFCIIKRKRFCCQLCMAIDIYNIVNYKSRMMKNDQRQLSVQQKSHVTKKVLSRQHPYQVIIKNGSLIIDNYVLPYENQVIYDHNKLYLAQIGKKILIDDTILLYDQQFFYFSINQQLLQELQILDPSTALRILKNIPSLKEETFVYLLQAISLEKIQQLLIDDQFYLFLLISFQKLIYRNNITLDHQKQLLQKHIIGNLTSIYQRLFYILQNIQGLSSKIRSSLQILSNQLILTSINEPNFINKLAYLQKPRVNSKETTFDINFVGHLINIINFMQYISNPMIQEQRQINQVFFTSAINQLIFTKQCLNIIATNFTQIFLYQRKKLLLVLCFIVKLQNPIHIWNDIIFYEYLIAQANNNQTSDQFNNREQQIKGHNIQNGLKIRVNNKSGFRNLVMNSYLNCTADNWTMTLYLLQQLANPKISICNDSFQLLVNIFQEIIQLGIGLQQIDAISNFIIGHRLKIQQNSKFRLFVSHFLQIIHRLVQRQYKYYCQKKFKLTANKQKASYLKKCISKTYKINTKLICCLLRTFSKMFQKHILSQFFDYQYLSSVQKIFQMANNKRSMIDGVKRHFMRIIKDEYVKEEEKKIQKKKLSIGLLQSFYSKKYSLNQKKGTQTTLQKLMRISQNNQTSFH